MPADVTHSDGALAGGGGHLDSLRSALSPHGLILRGGFHPGPLDAGLEDFGTILLVGNAGSAMWEAFAPHIDGAPNPLDRWTRAVVEPIAMRFGAQALYPFGETLWPFQRWAERADTVFPSPLGILIHPEFGLWHAYRAALAFRERLPLPPRRNAQPPCDACFEKPCLRACPVGAFTGTSFDVANCAAHLSARDGDGGWSARCHCVGCLARNACPVGTGHRYREEQVRFHMAAFVRSVAGKEATLDTSPAADACIPGDE